MLLGLEAILAEDWALYHQSEPSEEREMWMEGIELEGIQVRRFAVKHLSTGYPMIFDKMEHWRKLMKRLRKSLLSDGNQRELAEAVLNFVDHIGQEPILSQRSKRFLDNRVEVYREVESNIRSIILAVEAGKPLKGTCELCSD